VSTPRRPPARQPAARQPAAQRSTAQRPPASCYVYILGTVGAARRLTYVGWTTDIDRRLACHNAGTGARFTRGRQWELLYLETMPDRRAAMSREWHLKRDRGFRRQVVQRCMP